MLVNRDQEFSWHRMDTMDEGTVRPTDQALVAFINHELRTPLTVLVAHTELLQDSVPNLPDTAGSSVAAIARAGERLLELAVTVSRLGELERTISECTCGGVRTQGAGTPSL